MRKRKCGGLLSMAALLCFTAKSQEKYSRVNIPLSSPMVKDFILGRLNLDHYEQKNNAVTAVLNGSEMNRLRHSGIAFRLITDDVVKATIDLNRNANNSTGTSSVQSANSVQLGTIIKTPASFGLGGSLKLGAAANNPGYFKYAEMITEMQNLQANYPGIVTLFTIGNSAEGNPIYAVKISDNVSVDENEPEVLYTGLQHAREAISGTGLIFFMEYLAENYSTNNQVKQLVDNRELFIIPCLNPDGYAYNYSGANASCPTTGGGLWRKNRRNTGGGIYNIGVDLNRNYAIDWSNCNGASSACGSSDKMDDTYYGPNAFSEPETQALRNFVTGRHFTSAIDQHCYGPYYSLPYGRPSLHPNFSHIDSAYYSYVPALMGQYNGHRAGNSPETVAYEVAGGIKDWLLMGDIGTGTKEKIYGMTGEAGGGDFWAPVSELIQLCKECCYQDLQLAMAAGDHFDVQDLGDMGLYKLSGFLPVNIKRVGLGSDPVTVSIVPILNLQTVGQPKTMTLNNYYDEKKDSIAYTLADNFVHGQKIQFAWKLESGGLVAYDTVTKFFNPLTLLEDDMEGDINVNWQTSVSPAGSTGWSYSNEDAFSGNKSMTESPGGNYTSSSTRTATYKNQFDLVDATAASLGFWVKYRSENFRDKLQVQVSTDGSSWTAISGTNTVAEDNTTSGGTLGGQPALTGIRENWSHELYDLTAFIGNPAVSLRFVFTSDADAGSFAFEKDNGFLIDNLKVVKTTDIYSLACKFGQLSARLQVNNTVQLNWDAFTDERHDYFEVERATERDSHFTAMKKIRGQSPYNALDLDPQNGSNYYRIKEVDRNGYVAYSNIVKIAMQQGLSASIFPNPVKDKLTVNLRSVSSGDGLRLILMDATGRKIEERSLHLVAGTNQVLVDMAQKPSQLYFLKIYSARNELLVNEKFIRR